jgi:hypothetical protein
MQRDAPGRRWDGAPSHRGLGAFSAPSSSRRSFWEPTSSGAERNGARNDHTDDNCVQKRLAAASKHVATAVGQRRRQPELPAR